MLAAVSAGADALGFNFWPRSPRYVTAGQARELLRAVPAGILRVAVLVDEKKEPGSYTVTWDAGWMASGVYVYRLSSGASIVTRKMTLVK